MPAKKWAFEDFVVGDVIELGSKRAVAEEIVAFASEFDPQPMHLDEEAGAASILGGLSASGWHTCAMFMRLLCDGLLLAFNLRGLARHRLREVEEARAGRRRAVRGGNGSRNAGIEVPPGDRAGHHPFRDEEPGRRHRTRNGKHDHVRQACGRSGSMTLDSYLGVGTSASSAPTSSRRKQSRSLPANSIRSRFTSTRRRPPGAFLVAFAPRVGIRQRYG